MHVSFFNETDERDDIRHTSRKVMEAEQKGVAFLFITYIGVCF